METAGIHGRRRQTSLSGLDSSQKQPICQTLLDLSLPLFISRNSTKFSYQGIQGFRLFFHVSLHTGTKASTLNQFTRLAKRGHPKAWGTDSPWNRDETIVAGDLLIEVG